MSGLRTESGAGASGWLDGPRKETFSDASDNVVVGKWIGRDGDDWCRVEIGEPGNVVWCPLSSGVFQAGAAVVVHLSTDGTPTSVEPPKVVNDSSPTTAIGHQGEALQAAGEGGVSVTGATVNSSGHLILQLSDGTSIDAGEMPGRNGFQWNNKKLIGQADTSLGYIGGRENFDGYSGGLDMHGGMAIWQTPTSDPIVSVTGNGSGGGRVRIRQPNLGTKSTTIEDNDIVISNGVGDAYTPTNAVRIESGAYGIGNLHLYAKSSYNSVIVDSLPTASSSGINDDGAGIVMVDKDGKFYKAHELIARIITLEQTIHELLNPGEGDGS
jgi:hypothetical protein